MKEGGEERGRSEGGWCVSGGGGKRTWYSPRQSELYTKSSALGARKRETKVKLFQAYLGLLPSTFSALGKRR